MSDLFDDMPYIFTDPETGFGEPVKYVSSQTGRKKTINAIWIEGPVIQGMDPRADAAAIRIEVREDDISNPAEGDEVTRTATKVTMKVVPPIKPDGNGMVSLTLSKIDE
jgi:hypothetical protein